MRQSGPGRWTARLLTEIPSATLDLLPIDSLIAMTDTIALPKALKTRLAKAAAKAHATPEQLARQAITAHLDYLDWREKAIRAGFESGETEGWQATDEVFAAVAAQRARRAGKQAA
jgi:predicted transcriptional regulator